jgi:hypothetical protein
MWNDRPDSSWRPTVSWRYDGFPLLPAGVYLLGVMQHEAGTIALAMWLWLFVVVVWTPWIVIRLAMARSDDDAWRAMAVLGVGLLPWSLFAVMIGPLTSPTGLLRAFPLFYLWGAGAMAMAALDWPPTHRRWSRTLLLAGGAGAYGLFALILLGALLLGVSELGAFAALAVLLGGLSAIAGGALVYAMVRRRRRA